MVKHVVIIGAGVAGLATAALLSRDGYRVTVLEKNAKLGGRARQYISEGYTFDMGPSWYMMPDVFDTFFAGFGKQTTDFYELKRLNTHYRVIFREGRTYNITSDMQANIRLFEQIEPGAGYHLQQFLTGSRQLYEYAMKDLVLSNYRSLLPLLTPRVFSGLFTAGLTESFHSAVARRFRHPDLQKIIEFTTVFLGGSPYNTPAFYTLIAHADFGLGVYHPIGGMHKIIEAITSLAQNNGVTIKTGLEVTHIPVLNGKTSGVLTNSGAIQADIVIATCDYHHAETVLLPEKSRTHPEPYWLKRTLSPSAFLMYLGIEGKLKNATHHLLYFDDSWERHFRTVYDRQAWPETPSFYLHCPTKSDPSLAPPGCDVLIVLVPVAPGLEDTDSVRKEFGEKMLDRVESILKEPIRNRIRTQRIFSHRDFSNDYHAYRGTAFGLAHTLLQTAPFRPRNYSRKVSNLYFAGQYTNPGIGVPIAILSAQIVHSLIKSDYG